MHLSVLCFNESLQRKCTFQTKVYAYDSNDLRNTATNWQLALFVHLYLISTSLFVEKAEK